MHDYRYKPMYVFYGRGRRYYGIEIEVDGSMRHWNGAEDLIYLNVCGKYPRRKKSTFAYLKYDGSLVNGVEIVTMPGTLRFWQNNHAELQSVIDNVVQWYDADAYDTCGLHIHVSRSGFNSRNHIARFSNLVTRMYKTLLHIVRRDFYQAEEYADACRIVQDYEDLARHGRYHAVNVCPKQTVEFRLPSSTTDAARVIGYVELVDWLIEFSSDCDDIDLPKDSEAKRRFLLKIIPRKYKFLRELIRKTNFVIIEAPRSISEYRELVDDGDYEYDDDSYDDNNDDNDDSEAEVHREAPAVPECCSCRSAVVVSEAITDSAGNLYCDHCAREFLHCRLCGAQLPHQLPLDLCQDCFSHHTTSCQFCGAVIIANDDNMVNGMYVCGVCRQIPLQCHSCGREFPITEEFTISRNGIRTVVRCADCAHEMEAACA